MTALTKNSIALNRTLFLEDNLPVLRGLDSDSIDLIATDPPFNKGVPSFTGTTEAGENVEFKDVWHWGDVQDGWTDEIEKEHPSLFNVIRYANDAAGDDMGAFLCWMAVRMLEMHRVLKPTGSIYLHCDSTASHYLKAMMDAVFGRKQFRNEITWRRVRGAKNDASQYGRSSDSVFWYSKGDTWTFHPPRLSTVDPSWYKKEDEKGFYCSAKLLGAGATGGDSGQVWRGVEPKGHWVVPRLLAQRYEREQGKDLHGEVRERLDILADAGYIDFSSRGNPSWRRYLHEANPPRVDDIWDDDETKPIGRLARERTGYPTQKPLALYKRMIAASSNPGDIVLDPFAGCATTCVAAEQLGRQWIGIDIREESGGVIRDRLEREVNGSMAWDDIVRTPTEAPERTDDGEPAAPELVLESPMPNARKIPVQEARRLLIERDGQRCQGCGWQPPYPDYLQVDHKKPKTLKGKDEMDNYALLCDPCNRKKSNKMALSELRRARLDEGRIDAKWYEERARWE